MWQALRSDLKEFVSSVAVDGEGLVDSVTDNKSSYSSSELDAEKESAPGSEDSSQEGLTRSSDDDELLLGADGEVAYVGNYVEAEVERRIKLKETYTSPLFNHEVNGEKFAIPTKLGSNKNSESCCGEENPKPDSSENPDMTDSIKTEASENVQIMDENHTDQDAGQSLTNIQETEKFVSDMDDVESDHDALKFLNFFDISTKTDEISHILQKYPDSVGIFFEELVPITVTYEQFWQRYFYRCDPDRIQAEWDKNDEELLRERQEIIDKGVESVKNLWGGALKVGGGALKAFKNVGKQEDHKVGSKTYEKYQAEVEQQQKAVEAKINDASGDNKSFKSVGLGIGLFQGRPPFVMNSTDSGDEDEEIMDEEDYEEEDEEDLGWGSDDEDEDFSSEATSDQNEIDQNESEQEITFSSSDNVIEERAEEIVALKEEREQLKSTIENQEKEISKLTSSISISINEKDLSEIEHLKMVIFEKDSELAALHASLDDNHEESSTNQKAEAKISAQSRDIGRLQTQLLEKNDEILKISRKLESYSEDKEKAQAGMKRVEELQDKLSKAENELTEYGQLHSKLVMEYDEFKVKSSEEISTLCSDLSSLKSELGLKKEENERLKNEVKHFKKQMEEKDKTLNSQSKEEDISIPDIGSDSTKAESSMSSCVNVIPDSKINEVLDGNDDDWGDSWGDDDD
mmetsp:Transcript_8820/g.12536  ORF Transcript_8820/g.12536 Transcript_8820/m.12536 type:complete len:688 (-) Transcript_8820:193-2256(-)